MSQLKMKIVKVESNSELGPSEDPYGSCGSIEGTIVSSQRSQSCSTCSSLSTTPTPYFLPCSSPSPRSMSPFATYLAQLNTQWSQSHEVALGFDFQSDYPNSLSLCLSDEKAFSPL
ncbi:hypothetical protein RUM43_007594 [Polyplax serrata]|uniref:Uncharacterized protein n=1 Tax=Polyplax serrata TaxID=468196 RepID=A0AAN8PXB1_POLSC